MRLILPAFIALSFIASTTRKLAMRVPLAALLAIALTLALVLQAATNEVYLTWDHESLTKPEVESGLDPDGRPLTATNPPITFYFYGTAKLSTNIDTWTFIAAVANTNRHPIRIDTSKYLYVVACASNALGGRSFFSETAVWAADAGGSLRVVR